jgi:hypothetical protein
MSAQSNIERFSSEDNQQSTNTDGILVNSPNICNISSSSSSQSMKSPKEVVSSDSHTGSSADEPMVFGDLSFAMSDAETLCNIIYSHIDENTAAETLRTRGKGFDWDSITRKMNSLTQSIRVANEYRRIWKYIAYGELYDKNTVTYPDSDEVGDSHYRSFCFANQLLAHRRITTSIIQPPPIQDLIVKDMLI